MALVDVLLRLVAQGLQVWRANTRAMQACCLPNVPMGALPVNACGIACCCPQCNGRLSVSWGWTH